MRVYTPKTHIARANVRTICYNLGINSIRGYIMRRNSANARIDMRATKQDKHYLEMAAFLAGYKSLTDFILEVTKERAEELFARSKLEQLSEEDSVKFMQLCQNAPEPNEKLRNAYSKIAANYNLDGIGNIEVDVDDSLIKTED